MSKSIDDAKLEQIAKIIEYQHILDYEGAGPKAPHGDITYKNVRLSSRFDVQSEFDHMKAVIDCMLELNARRIESIWCDSKACAVYIITIRPDRYLQDLPRYIDDAFKARGGYNGLSIVRNEQEVDYRDCYWLGD
jgi:hypothetical protein